MCYSHVWKMPREIQLYPSMQGNAETTARFWVFFWLTLHLMTMTQGLTLNWMLSILSILAGLGGFHHRLCYLCHSAPNNDSET